MQIPFDKLHGAKNDFLLTTYQAVETTDLPDVAIAICDRYTGVGADGWILIDRTGCDDYDATIRLFNSDGSEPELSGNGTRCVAALLARMKPGQTDFRIRTGAGIKHLRCIAANQFEMNMGVVKLVELHARVQDRDAVLVNPGNPQCVFPVADFELDWRALGAATERDARFPNRTNVSFIRRVDDHSIDVRFWERGAGETMSSGTGSTGAATAALALGWVEAPVTVQTPAGPLQIRLRDDEALLTGPAEFICEGTFYLPD